MRERILVVLNDLTWYPRFGDVPGISYKTPAGLTVERLPGFGVSPEIRRYEGAPDSLEWGNTSQSPAAARASYDDRNPDAAWIIRRLQEALNYITAEIHKAYSPLFKPDVLAAVREERLAYLKRRYALVEKQLEGRQYLFGDRFTVADAYLYAVTRWARGVKLDLSGFPNLNAFQERVSSRKAVREALAEEGLLPASKAA